MIQGEIVVANPLECDLAELRQFFRSSSDEGEIRNPHIESRVSQIVRDSAKPSSVLVIVTDEAVPRVLLTKRQSGIRFGGHLCFPGGRADAGESVFTTALRESEEEIGLDPDAVEVLGTFGHYYTQAGFRIDPVVGIVAADYVYQPAPNEVASIHYTELSRMLNPDAYDLKNMTPERAYFGFETGEVRVGGPTVSLMIGFLEWCHKQQSITA